MGVLTTPVVALGVASTLLSLAIGGVAWQQRQTRGAKTYAGLAVVLTVWTALYVAQLLSPTVPAKRPWFVARHAMSPLFALGFWVFAARYTGRRELLDRRYLAPIAAVGLACVGLVLANPGGLYWSTLALDATGEVPLLDLTLGPLFWGNCAYIFSVVAVTHVVIVSQWKRPFGSYRPQLVVMTAIGSIEFALALLFLSEHTSLLPVLNPWPNVQLISYGAAISAVPVGWSYFNDALFDIQPLARQAVIESMDDAVFVIDHEGTIRYTNPPGNRLLGRPPDADAPREPVEDAFAPRPTLRRCYRQWVARGELTDDESSVVDCEIDGEQRFYDISISTLQNSAKVDGGVVVVAHDITEARRKRGQLRVRTAQLERQNERLDQFGEFVSHDLRNPIQVASGHVELARQTGNLSRLDDIDDAIERMDEMVTDLRELTTVDRERVDTTPVNIATAAHTAWTYVDTDGATLTVAENAIVNADEDYLLHIFENLFRNAVEHGSTGNRTQSDDAVEHGSTSPDSRPRQDALEHGSTGNRTQSDDAVAHGSTSPDSQPRQDAVEDGSPLTVTVGTLEDGFYVADDGVGIPEADRETILDYGYSAADDSTGLGTAIVRTVADAHGWAVSVTESAAGGARFEFSGVDRADE